MPLTYAVFHQHVKHLRSLMFNQTANAIIEREDLEDFQCKFDGNRYIAVVANNPLAPDIVIKFPLCNRKHDFFLLFTRVTIWIIWTIIFFLTIFFS